MKNLKIAYRLVLSTSAFLALACILTYFFVQSVQDNVDVARLELKGNAYQRPLMQILLGLTQGEVNGSLDKAKIDQAFEALVMTDQAIGADLQFTPEGLASRKRDHLNAKEVNAKWERFKAGDQKDYQSLIDDVRGMITHLGNTSGLILDPDLDSYYTMDATLLTLPQLLDRLGKIGLQVSGVLQNQKTLTSQDKLDLLSFQRITKEFDVGHTVSDFQTAFNEDVNFNGSSLTFKSNVEPKLDAFDEINGTLATLITSMNQGRNVSLEDWHTAILKTQQATIDLWDVSVNELDTLLKIRIKNFQLHMAQVLGTVFVGLVFASLFFYYIARSIRKPLFELQYAMSEISQGDLNFAVPHTDLKDEIGHMARTVQIFKDTSIKAQQMSSEQQHEQELKTLRQDTIENEIQIFDLIAAQSVQSVASAANQLQATFEKMAETVTNADHKVSDVASLSQRTAENVQTVAAATEEMQASINEVNSQVVKSAEVAQEALQSVIQGETAAQSLSEAAIEIGNVTNLIKKIADQINLLALNATIESARAGEAGKGFAVVASEVKILANQTATATDDINHQIQNMQSISMHMVDVIASIKTTVNHVHDYSKNIELVIEQQSAAIQEISSNMQSAAGGVNTISSNVVDVKEATTFAGEASKEVLQASTMLSDKADELSHEIRGFLSKMTAA